MRVFYVVWVSNLDTAAARASLEAGCWAGAFVASGLPWSLVHLAYSDDE